MGKVITYENLSKDQKEAADLILDWYFNHDSKQVFSLAGYAGTGKTTLIKTVVGMIKKEIDFYNSQVKFLTYTGKASVVMAMKGLSPVSTIHSLIYKPEGKEEDEKGEERLSFRKREYIDKDIILLVVDEVSMVPDWIWEDLKSFDIKILATGDPGQLPPVRGGENKLIKYGDYDYILTKIHRQAKGNPIIQISKKIREGKGLKYGTYRNKKGEVKVAIIPKDRMKDEYLIQANQVICGYNKTRKKLNNKIRDILGFKSDLPEKGDKVICIYNNWNLSIEGTIRGGVMNQKISLVNGLVGECINSIRSVDSEMGRFRMDFKPDFLKYSYFSNILVSSSEFYGKSDDKHALYYEDEFPNQFDFGYVVSCHKAEGSQWDKVLLINEPFRSYSFEKQKQWLYTAVTRARDRLVLVTDRNLYG